MGERFLCLTHRYAWVGVQVCPVGNAHCMTIATVGHVDKRLWLDLRMKQRSDAEYAALSELSLACRDRSTRLPLLAQAVTRLGRVMRFEGAA